jgi:HSP20 family protein
MTLMRWSPLEEMNILRNQVDRIFEPTVANGNRKSLSHFFPVEVTEKQDQYMVKLMVPGINPEQIQVESTQKELVITAETQPRELDKDENVHLSEFHYGKFSRHLSFPLAIDTEKIEANYEFGILKIRVPKTEPAKRKHVEVKVKQA